MRHQIRRATLDDLDAVAPLFDAYRQLHAQAADLPRSHAFLRERLQRGESMLLLAQHDDRVVGFTQLFPMFSSLRTARLWILNDLYVDASARRRGVARALLDAAAQFGRDDGVARLMLKTGRANTPARALYVAAGWAEDDVQGYSLDLAAPR